MSPTIKAYLEAVAKRKPRLVSSGQVNVATLMQLQDDDVPRLIRMIEELCVTSHDHTAAERLAEEGNKARWGSFVPPNWYRSRPVAKQALQWTGKNMGEIDAFMWEAPRSWKLLDDGKFAIDIKTLEGVVTASPGDWIIKGVKGEFYPCKDEIFRATYEPA